MATLVENGHAGPAKVGGTEEDGKRKNRKRPVHVAFPLAAVRRLAKKAGIDRVQTALLPIISKDVTAHLKTCAEIGNWQCATARRRVLNETIADSAVEAYTGGYRIVPAVEAYVPSKKSSGLESAGAALSEAYRQAGGKLVAAKPKKPKLTGEIADGIVLAKAQVSAAKKLVKKAGSNPEHVALIAESEKKLVQATADAQKALS